MGTAHIVGVRLVGMREVKPKCNGEVRSSLMARCGTRVSGCLVLLLCLRFSLLFLLSLLCVFVRCNELLHFA